MVNKVKKEEKASEKDKYPWLEDSDERKHMTEKEILDKYIDLDNSCLTESEKMQLGDIIRIDGREVFVTLNGTIIQLPILVKIPLRDKYRLRCIMRKSSLLLHVMLRQGTFWYALENILASTTTFRTIRNLIADGK